MIGTPLPNTIAAASGSTNALNSAAGVMFPSAIAPPIHTMRSICHAALDQTGDVRQRAGRDEDDAWLEPLRRIVAGRLRRRLRQVGPVEPALAVHVRRGAERPLQRRGGALDDRDVRAAGELQHLERVARRLVDGLVAGDRDDAAQLHLR